jgi:hypothetical protein
MFLCALKYFIICRKTFVLEFYINKANVKDYFLLEITCDVNLFLYINVLLEFIFISSDQINISRKKRMTMKTKLCIFIYLNESDKIEVDR